VAHFDIIISIVTYQTKDDTLKRCIDSILGTNLRIKLYIIDNSPTDKIKSICCNSKIRYIFNNANIGYGAGHNIAIKKTIAQKIKYHLVLNPDIYFEKGTIEKLYDFMESNPDISLVMPKVLYPDGSIQYLCKLLPTPMDLIRRRFFPPSKYLDKKSFFYELRFAGYDKIIDVPYLSGCFMFVRTEALVRAGLFDEQFFLYLEDLDLSRRIHEYYRTVYCPEVSVFHQYEKGSYKNSRLLKYHIQSAIKYFNKWGYFFDKKRQEINKIILEKLNVL
jgi:GT2 family glycosyltransferase